MFTLFKKKETPSLWTHNTRESGHPSTNKLTAAGMDYQAKMMNSNPMKNFMFDRYFGIDETLPEYQGMNCFVFGDEKRDIADRVFRHQIEQFKSSFVISTTSPVLFGMTRGELAKHGYNIRILNFTNTDELGNLSNQVEQSLTYNVFEQAQGRAAVDDLARSLIRQSPTYSHDNAFLNSIVRALIAAAISLKQINNDTNVNSVYNFIESAYLKTPAEKKAEKNKFDKAFEEAMVFADVGSEENKQRAIDAHEFYKVFINACGKSRDYIIQTALNVLKSYPGCQHGQRVKNFNLKELTSRKFALFIMVDNKDAKLAANARVVTQAIVSQFEREAPRGNVRFMIEGVEKYFKTADFTTLYNHKGKYSYTAILHNMDKLDDKEKVTMEKMVATSDLMMYMGSQNSTDPKHTYAMEMVSKAQTSHPEFENACKIAKKDPTNKACVYSPKNNISFDMAANEQIVFVKGCTPFLLTYVY